MCSILPSHIVDELMLEAWASRERLKENRGKVYTYTYQPSDLKDIPDPIKDAIMRHIKKHGRMP